MYFMPKTKIGKISFWLGVSSFAGIYLNYWLSLLGANFPRIFMIIFGIILICVVISCGITSIVAIIKYKDHAISLFLSALIGILGILFVIGEFVFSH